MHLQLKLQTLWTEKWSNKVLRKAGVQKTMMKRICQWQLVFQGHAMRRHGLENLVVAGRIEGRIGARDWSIWIVCVHSSSELQKTESSGMTWSPTSSLTARHLNKKHGICSPACPVEHLCHLSRCWRFPQKLRQSWPAPYCSSRLVSDWMPGQDSAVTVHKPYTQLIYMRIWHHNIAVFTIHSLLCHRKTPPFLFFCDIFVRYHLSLPFLSRNIPQRTWDKHKYTAYHISFDMRHSVCS